MAIRFRLKALLADAEKTQLNFSKETGIRQPTVSAICTNSVKHIPVNVLDTICKTLHCQPGDLIKYVEDEEIAKGGD